MPTLTPNYSFNKPLVNNATDADLWGGYLNANWDSLDTILNTFSTAPKIGRVIFRVDNEDPNVEFPGTTWVQIAEGRFIVGVGQGTDADAANRTYPAGDDSFGTYEHTLTVDEIPDHSHNINTGLSGETISISGNLEADRDNDGTTATSGTGGGGAHENSPPAFGLYVWERTA